MQQSFLLALQRLYPSVELIIFAFQYPYHNKPYEWHGIPVIPFNGQNKGGLSKLLLYRKILIALKKLHTEKPIDGILSFWYTECGYIGKRFADKHSITHRCWIWGRDAAGENKFPGRLLPNPNELVTYPISWQMNLIKIMGCDRHMS